MQIKSPCSEKQSKLARLHSTHVCTVHVLHNTLQKYTISLTRIISKVTVNIMCSEYYYKFAKSILFSVIKSMSVYTITY